MSKTCETCFWYDDYTSSTGFCDEKEQYIIPTGYCPKWKDRGDDYNDRCYECGGYGDDYYTDDDGNLDKACDDCPYGGNMYEDW